MFFSSIFIFSSVWYILVLLGIKLSCCIFAFKNASNLLKTEDDAMGENSSDNPTIKACLNSKKKYEFFKIKICIL